MCVEEKKQEGKKIKKKGYGDDSREVKCMDEKKKEKNYKKKLEKYY